MTLQDLINSGQPINITIGLSDLETFGKSLISNCKTELQAEVTAQQKDSYLTRLETCEFLRVDQSTLWRFQKRNYLNPVSIGGRRLYKLSDLNLILNGSK